MKEGIIKLVLFGAYNWNEKYMNYLKVAVIAMLEKMSSDEIDELLHDVNKYNEDNVEWLINVISEFK